MFRSITKLAGNLTALRYQNKHALSVAHSLTNNSKPIASYPDANNASADRQTQSRASDITDLKQIEASLFENGNRHSEPIDSRALLQQYAAKPTKRPFTARKGHHGSNNNRFRKSPEQSAAAPLLEKKPKPPKVKSSIVENTELGLTYTKLHLNDPWLNTLLLSVKSRKSRSLRHQLLVEGRRLIIDAIQSGLQLDHILFSDIAQLQLLRDHLPADAQLVKVPQGDLRLWSNLATCPGLMAVFTKPTDMETLWQQPRRHRLPISVICDQIREPNNVGSVIRNCAAAGCEQVILTKGCADPWESKALRGGAGAQFKLPVRGPCEWSSIRSMLPEENCFVYLAENSRENALAQLQRQQQGGDDAEAEAAAAAALSVDDAMRVYSDVTYAGRGGRHSVVVIGGETEGLSADAYRLLQSNVLGKCVQIPLAEEVESLNTGAALAVILFEIRRQLLAAQGGD